METSSLNRENDVWGGVFSRIKEAMGKRTASDAVLYVLTHDKIPYLLPINLVGAKDLAADLSSKDKIKYVGFILIAYHKQGPPSCEFHPIYPSMAWPQAIVQGITERALEAIVGNNDTEDDLKDEEKIEDSRRRPVQGSHAALQPRNTQAPLAL